MRIDLTKEQGDELFNPFWDIDYAVTLPDGTEHEGNTGEDDLHELPENVLIGEPGQILDDRGRLVGYAIAHVSLTWEDEVLLKHVLDERAAHTARIAALPREDRAEARQALRQEIRQAARRDARRAARRAARQADRQAARRQMREDLRAEATDKLAVARAEREAAEAKAEAAEKAAAEAEGGE